MFQLRQQIRRPPYHAIGRFFSSGTRNHDALKIITEFGGKDGFQGTLARTDSSVQVGHPPENELPKSRLVQGRGGLHYQRTLSSFSLEGKVGVVTGGARGLGLMMSQALIISGADLAIVDLDSKYGT
jgi:D-arabinitol 2-dehydrogenase